MHNKILVTGADGFIGSHLVELLLKMDFKLRALSYYNSFNSHGWLEKIERDPNLEIVSGDVRDPFFCESLTEGIDVVFHLAALIAIPYSYIAPGSYIDTNVKGTLNICQAALKNNIKKVIIISTSEVYGTAKYVPIDESHPKQPQSPYSASKIGADSLAMSYYNSFGLPVIIARPFNTFGPRQSARAVIPSIIIQIASGKKIVSLGDTSPSRDFTFVTDTCKGLIALSNCDSAIGKEVNICSGTETSIGDIFALINHLMNAGVEIEKIKERMRPARSEVFRLLGDNSTIRNLTGWQPGISLEEGLRKTITWISNPENISKYKAGSYNI